MSTRPSLFSILFLVTILLTVLLLGSSFGQSFEPRPMPYLSPAGSYPEWDEGFAGADDATRGEDPNYEDQGKMGTTFDTWDG